MSGRHQPENGADSPTALITIGAAVRVNAREERARYRYKVARWNHLHQAGIRSLESLLREALVARARWTALVEIIEAEERRVRAA